MDRQECVVRFGIVILCLFIWTGIQQVLAQENLIPNAGFEEIREETMGHADISNINSWFNANQRKPSSLHGTPDHMFINGESSLKGVRASVLPHTGKSVLGLITYMQRVKDYREFASVKLTTTLEKGKRYYCSFYLSNGNDFSYGSIAASGLGFTFSSQALNQYSYEPIRETPQFYMKKAHYIRGWEKVEFEFVAEENYQYLTIGNFFKDKDLSLIHINYDVDPQCYVYIDDLELIAVDDKEQPDDLAKQEPVKELYGKEAERDSLLESRSVEDQLEIILPAKTKKVTIKIWDDKTVDGDEVSALFNNKWLVKNYRLGKAKKTIKFEYKEGEDNRLILFAHNLGRTPPNTTAILIKAGNVKKTIRIRSDFGKCGAIKFSK